MKRFSVGYVTGCSGHFDGWRLVWAYEFFDTASDAEHFREGKVCEGVTCTSVIDGENLPF